MTGETPRAPRRRRRAALLAVLFLLVGLGLLFFSATYLPDRSNPPELRPPPRETTSPSPIVDPPVAGGRPEGTRRRPRRSSATSR